MKVAHLFLVVALVLGLTSLAWAADGSWEGWIADENCAKNYQKAANAGHAGCAKACASRGARWALATENGHFLLEMEGAEQHLGHAVVITGDLDEASNTITVASVSMAGN